eukprot:1688505-Ditylum_brightwellii.AAC.1
MRWMVEIGQVDILAETAVLSKYLAQPRVGQLSQVLQIFNYLKHHKTSWLPMDTGMVNLVWEPRGNKISLRNRAKVTREYYPDASGYSRAKRQRSTDQLFCLCQPCIRLCHQEITDMNYDILQ